MNERRFCPDCRAELPPDIAEGLCPKCLLQAGLTDSSDEKPPADRRQQSSSTQTIDSPPPEMPAGQSADADEETNDSSSPTEPEKARYFGDYELKEEIARGGMGIVYRARQVSLNRLIALKMIKSGEFADEREVRRFRDEAEAAANLDHPHIVPIFEVGEHEGQQYFAMKLIEGESLDRCLDRFTDQPKVIAKLMVQVAGAVQHAHQHGLIHRDLKPANILMDTDGAPHVTDFGLAKRIDGGKGLTQSGAIVGTPKYMAPEQARADKSLTTAVDVYSLGAILYALLTGKPPFQTDNLLEILVQVCDQEPARPQSVYYKADRELQTICLKCLEKQPHRRYGSAAELADDLQRCLDNKPIRARRVGRIERVLKWIRRRPAAAALLATGLMAAISVVALGMWIFIEREYRFQVVQTKEEQIRKKKDEIERRSEELAKEKAELEKRNAELKRRDWLGRLTKARSERLAGNRWEALAILKDLGQKLKRTPSLGEKSLLHHEAFEAVNTAGARLVRKIELRDRNWSLDWRSVEPHFSADSSALMLLVRYGVRPLPINILENNARPGESLAKTEERLAREKSGIYVYPLPNGECRIRNEWIDESSPHLIWFAERGANIKIASAKKGMIGEETKKRSIITEWDPWTNKTTVETLPGTIGYFLNGKGSRLGRFRLLTSPNSEWQAKGKYYWKKDQKEKPLKLAQPARAFFADQSLILEEQKDGSFDTIIFEIPTGKKIVIPGRFTAVLSHELILVNRRAVWNVPKKEKVFDAEHLQYIAHSSGWQLAAYHNTKTNQTELWNSRGGKQIAILPEIMHWPRIGSSVRRSAIFSKNSRYFICETKDKPNQIQIWDRITKQVTRVARPLVHHFSAPLHPNNQILAAWKRTLNLSFPTGPVEHGKYLQFWDLEAQGHLASIHNRDNPTHSNSIWSNPKRVIWSSDGRFFTTAPTIDGMNTYYAWEFSFPNPVYVLDSPANHLKFSVDGTQLAVNGDIWKVQNHKDQISLERPIKTSGADLAFFGRSGQIFKVHNPSWYNFNNQQRPKPIRVVQTFPTYREIQVPWPKNMIRMARPFQVYAFGLSPSGKKFVVFYGRPDDPFERHGKCFQLDVWNLDGKEPQLIWRHGDINRSDIILPYKLLGFIGAELVNSKPLPINRVQFSDDEAEFMVLGHWSSVTGFGTAGVFQIMEKRSIRCRRDPILITHYRRNFDRIHWNKKNILFFDKSDGIEKRSKDRRVIRWKLSKSMQLKGHRGKLAKIVFSRKERFVAATDYDLALRLWDLSTGRLLLRWQPHEQHVTAMVFSPDSKTLITAANDNTLKVWNLDYIRKELRAIGLD